MSLSKSICFKFIANMASVSSVTRRPVGKLFQKRGPDDLKLRLPIFMRVRDTHNFSWLAERRCYPPSTELATIRWLRVVGLGWVDPWVGLDWVEIFQILVGWVGSKNFGNIFFSKISKN